MVIVNNHLLVKPEDLPAKSYTPFVADITTPDGKNAILFGTTEYPSAGENKEFFLMNNKGKKICTGRYSLSSVEALFGEGKVEVQCFDNKLKAQGKMWARRINLKHIDANATVGYAVGHASDGSVLKILTGIPIDYYDDYKF